MRDGLADGALRGRVVCGNDDERRHRNLVQPLVCRIARPRPRAVGHTAGIRRGLPELTHRVVGSERCPDGEVAVPSPSSSNQSRAPFTSTYGIGATIACRAMRFEHVLVVGAGQMGSGIAQVVAASGRRVSLHDAAPGAVERGLEAMRKSLTRLAEKGGTDPDVVLARVEPAGEIVAADLMIEAVVEDAAVKEQSRPDRVIGMHFFNPVPVLKLVEVIRGLETSDETARAITELADELGKTAAEARDFPGFVSNRILMPFINEAAYALLEGVAEAEAIDTIARLGFAHPLGPLALADLIGLDTCVAIMEVLHRGLGDPKYAPCPLLRQYVQAGRLGRKSGRGFYEYS